GDRRGGDQRHRAAGALRDPARRHGLPGRDRPAGPGARRLPGQHGGAGADRQLHLHRAGLRRRGRLDRHRAGAGGGVDHQGGAAVRGPGRVRRSGRPRRCPGQGAGPGRPTHRGGSMTQPTIREVRATTVRGRGADYHDQSGQHWIDDHIATPMAIYPEYRQSRQSFGLNVLGTLVVEIEASDGTVGFAVTTGGEIGAWIVEKHLARFLEGRPVTDLERIWDQMYRATLFYGRRGIVLNTISGVDLALYDLLGRLRQEPVYALLGGPVRDELTMYATGARPDLAKQMGFIG